eukprot:224528_1
MKEIKKNKITKGKTRYLQYKKKAVARDEKRITMLGSGEINNSNKEIIEHMIGHGSYTNYTTNYECTIYVDGKTHRISIHDTSEQQQLTSLDRIHRALLQHSIRECDGMLLIYDVNSRNSFEYLNSLYEAILEFRENKRIDMVVVGDKGDTDVMAEVSYDEGKELADSWGCPFIETSAKT